MSSYFSQDLIQYRLDLDVAQIIAENDTLNIISLIDNKWWILPL